MNPSLGMFMGRDDYLSTVNNLYGYVNLRPLRKIDPTGHQEFDISIVQGTPNFKSPDAIDYSVDLTIVLNPRTMPTPRPVELWIRNETTFIYFDSKCKQKKISNVQYDFFPLYDEPGYCDACPRTGFLTIPDNTLQGAVANAQACLVLSLGKKEFYFNPHGVVFAGIGFEPGGQRTAIPESSVPRRILNAFGQATKIYEFYELYSFFNKANCPCDCFSELQGKWEKWTGSEDPQLIDLELLSK